MARTVIVIDDHPICATAIAQVLNDLEPDAIVRNLSTLRELEQLDAEAAIDLILLDLKLPDAVGMQGIERVRSAFPEVPICVISGQADSGTVRQVLAHEADGFIPKTCSYRELHQAISRLLSGERIVPRLSHDPADEIGPLSPAESRIMRSLCLGLQNKQIAYELGISESTVKSHLAHVFSKLRVQNRSQAIMVFSRLIDDTGLLSPRCDVG